MQAVDEAAAGGQSDTELGASIRGALAEVPHAAFAIVFGSMARGTSHAGSDLDIALGFTGGHRPTAREIGDIVSGLEDATGHTVDLLELDRAPSGLAYRVFRDGEEVWVRDRPALVARKAKVILEYLDFEPLGRAFSDADPTDPVVEKASMIDRPVVARGIAAVHDAAARIRETLPAEPEDLAADRTKREVVVLNLFVAIQECLSLATHWLADEGRSVPATYGEVFRALAEHHVIHPGLASGMAAAAGLRNLIVHRYGDLDWERVHEVGTHHLSDLLEFCESLQRSIPEEAGPSRRGGE